MRTSQVTEAESYMRAKRERNEKGVGLMFDKDKTKHVLGYQKLSEFYSETEMGSIQYIHHTNITKPEEEIIKFYKDLNAKVGKEQDNEIVSNRELAINAEKNGPIDTQNNQVLTNTWF